MSTKLNPSLLNEVEKMRAKLIFSRFLVVVTVLFMLFLTATYVSGAKALNQQIAVGIVKNVSRSVELATAKQQIRELTTEESSDNSGEAEVASATD
jgi:hypothetical protein